MGWLDIIQKDLNWFTRTQVPETESKTYRVCYSTGYMPQLKVGTAVPGQPEDLAGSLSASNTAVRTYPGKSQTWEGMWLFPWFSGSNS